MSDPSASALVFVEHVVWQPGAEWRLAVEHVAQRFARVAALDVDEVAAVGALHVQLEHLASWGEQHQVDLDREFGRFFDEHLAMHVRPDTKVTRALRAMAAQGTVQAASALPPRAAESIARHTGVWRSFSGLHAELRTADALERVLTTTPPAALVAREPTPVPEHLAVPLFADLASFVSRPGAGE
ncbi:MAG: hypothetical protein JWN41_1492 [Thermoleophilia bacterium]|nr:hypothetical protein [Thermoleophilia bacterium]